MLPTNDNANTTSSVLEQSAAMEEDKSPTTEHLIDKATELEGRVLKSISTTPNEFKERIIHSRNPRECQSMDQKKVLKKSGICYVCKKHTVNIRIVQPYNAASGRSLWDQSRVLCLNANTGINKNTKRTEIQSTLMTDAEKLLRHYSEAETERNRVFSSEIDQYCPFLRRQNCTFPEEDRIKDLGITPDIEEVSKLQAEENQMQRLTETFNRPCMVGNRTQMEVVEAPKSIMKKGTLIADRCFKISDKANKCESVGHTMYACVNNLQKINQKLLSSGINLCNRPTEKYLHSSPVEQVFGPAHTIKTQKVYNPSLIYNEKDQNNGLDLATKFASTLHMTDNIIVPCNKKVKQRCIDWEEKLGAINKSFRSTRFNKSENMDQQVKSCKSTKYDRDFYVISQGLVKKLQNAFSANQQISIMTKANKLFSKSNEPNNKRTDYLRSAYINFNPKLYINKWKQEITGKNGVSPGSATTRERCLEWDTKLGVINSTFSTNYSVLLKTNTFKCFNNSTKINQQAKTSKLENSDLELDMVCHGLVKRMKIEYQAKQQIPIAAKAATNVEIRSSFAKDNVTVEPYKINVAELRKTYLNKGATNKIAL
ncbi:uncharacterized protein LOC119688966 isoform X2 [Teleopsis dalmanni]|uniref:uncharacterized protein LOC119688966 isoform X2 n=1 Tax=Teleopsis dalmanni TaxID=139649 RepID=UPI0018CDD87F|nr:uncharacterized protein LOC119688966 isoform X2 [Teleopsis dalmanni]